MVTVIDECLGPAYLRSSLRDQHNGGCGHGRGESGKGGTFASVDGHNLPLLRARG